ncbi:MAG: hypothetical protein I3J02_12120 [Prevotella sp.]|nr:hypothetical protein [Prevotella sp.]
MKQQYIFLSSIALLLVAALSSCGTQKTVSTPSHADTLATAAPLHANTSPVVPNKELVSIAEAAEAVSNPDALAAVAKKYGYKVINGYGIYRLDSYDKMYYRNCLPAKSLGKGMYADTPQPTKRGTSSYIALGQSVIIGVFNSAAYQNLVDQVKGLGYTLVEQGYEDRYTNGTVDIYCYAARKTVRLEKAVN